MTPEPDVPALEHNAIESVKALLIECLREDKFCQARNAGEALKILVNNRQPQGGVVAGLSGVGTGICEESR